MSYKLVIAEKPSVAQSIAKVIGADKREDGHRMVCRTFGRTHNVYGYAGVCGFAVGGLGGMDCQPEKKQIISYEGNIKI